MPQYGGPCLTDKRCLIQEEIKRQKVCPCYTNAFAQVITTECKTDQLKHEYFVDFQVSNVITSVGLKDP